MSEALHLLPGVGLWDLGQVASPHDIGWRTYYPHFTEDFGGDVPWLQRQNRPGMEFQLCHLLAGKSGQCRVLEVQFPHLENVDETYTYLSLSLLMNTECSTLPVGSAPQMVAIRLVSFVIMMILIR